MRYHAHYGCIIQRVALNSLSILSDQRFPLDFCKIQTAAERNQDCVTHFRLGESLRACARVLAAKAQDHHLVSVPEEMGKSQFPEVQMTRIRDCIRRMESALNKNFNTYGEAI